MMMTDDTLDAVRARLGSISNQRLAAIGAMSTATFKLLTVDIPALIKRIEDLKTELEARDNKVLAVLQAPTVESNGG